MGKIVLLLTIFMSVSLLGFSQTKTVTGAVKDESGNAVPFATVTEKGTKMPFLRMHREILVLKRRQGQHWKFLPQVSEHRI